MDGGAFLVGAMAIAGLPPLNGFASEWLTLQALLHVPAYGGVGDGIAGAIALAALAATAALAVFCFVKVVGLVLLGPPRRDAVANAQEAPLRDARRRSSSSRAACVVLGVAPGLLFAPLVGLAPWPASAPTSARAAPARHGLAADGAGSRSCSSRSRPLSRCSAAGGAPRRRRRWACGQLVEPALDWTSAGFTKPLRLVLEAVLRPEREIDGADARAASCRRSPTRPRPAPDRRARLPAG